MTLTRLTVLEGALRMSIVGGNVYGAEVGPRALKKLKKDVGR